MSDFQTSGSLVTGLKIKGVEPPNLTLPERSSFASEWALKVIDLAVSMHPILEIWIGE